MGNPKNALIDVETVLEDGAAATTATGVGQKDGADASVDFKNGASIGDGPAGDSSGPETLFDLLLDVISADDGDANETYVVDLELSTDAAFTSPVTALTVTITRGEANTRRKIPGTNQIQDTIYQHARVNATLGGTTPSLTYRAQLVKRESVGPTA